MAIIPQRQFFSWQEIENSRDLQRLQLVLKHLSDEPLMRLLESHRARDVMVILIRAVWNTVVVRAVGVCTESVQGSKIAFYLAYNAG